MSSLEQSVPFFGHNLQFIPLTGPLGLWNFPLMNALKQTLIARQMFRTTLRQQFMAPHPLLPRTRETMKNAEKWSMQRDERGRLVAIEVHRTVEEVQ